MYIHIGGGNVLNTEDIVGIFDLDITSQSKITQKYLSTAEKNGKVVNAAEDIPKTYIVCGKKLENKVYLCQPAPGTLQKRAENENAGLNG